MEISQDKKYSGTFVIIDNLCHDIILGHPALQELGFRLQKDKVELADTSINRITPIFAVSQHHSPVRYLPLNRQNSSDEDLRESRLSENTKVISIVKREMHRYQAHYSYLIDITSCVSSIMNEGDLLERQSSGRQDITQQVNKDNCLDDRGENKESVQDSEMWHSARTKSTLTAVGNENSVETDFNSNCEFDTDLDEAEESLFKNLIIQNRDIFSRNEDDIGLFVSRDGGPSKVSFEVMDPSKVVYSIPRRVPYARRQWLEGKLRNWIENGLIEEVTPSQSKHTIMTSPIIIVPKKNNRYRMAVDYRELNKNLKVTTHPLPNVRDAIESLGTKRYFSSLDITSAFNQIELTEETKRLCGFVTLGKRYLPNRMPFGAHPCPSKFQEFIERALKKVPANCCTIYLDDILISSNNFGDHLEDLRLVFHELQRHGLKLSPKKCSFFKQRVEYLGFSVGKIGDTWGYAPLEAKLLPLRELPVPQTAKEVRSFCGSLQYYNTMIPSLNIKLAPLHRGAAAKDFEMTMAMTDSFHEVKKMIEDKIVLCFPDFTKTFILATDASYNGAGAVLTQHNDKGGEDIIYIFSKAFNDVQTRWPIVELECLALVWALEKMETLLLGREFLWRTDSMVLKQMLQNPPKDLSRAGRKISRYIDFINSYRFTFEHFKGDQKEIRLADYLSRNPICSIQTLTIPLEEWKREIKKDSDLINGSGQWSKYTKKMFEEDGIIYMKKPSSSKIAVPKSLILRVIRYYHETYTIHGGVSRIIPLITRLFVWPNMYESIRSYVSNCPDCVTTKIRRPAVGVRRAIETPKSPWHWIQIDLVSVNSRRSKDGYQYILTSICTLTNFVQMEPIETKEACVVLRALCKIFCNTGVPKICQSDNGKEFRNTIIQQHAAFLQIEWRYSTPYKPSTNGRIERRHKDLSKLLKLLNTNVNNWHEELPYVVFELNISVDSITGLTPFEMFHGWQPRQIEVIDSLTYASDDVPFEEWAIDLDKAFWERKIRTRQMEMFQRIRNQRNLAKELDCLHQDITTQMVPGDRIMIKDITATGKLNKKMKGPYVIIKILPGGSLVAKDAKDKTVRIPANHAVRCNDREAREDNFTSNTDVLTTQDTSEEHHRPKNLRSQPVPDYSKFY